MRREEVATTWLRLDVGWRRGPSGTQVGFMKHWAWGWKSPETQSGAMRDQNGQTESSELLTAPRQRDDDGRKKGGGAEAPQRDQRCTHQGLVSPFLWQGQSGGEGGGGFNENSMAMTTSGWGCGGESNPWPVSIFICSSQQPPQLSWLYVICHIIYFQCTLPKSWMH